MQPQMVVGCYQNPLGTHNSCLGSTAGGNHLPWNFHIPDGNNASWNTNANWCYPSPMVGNSPEGYPMIYPSTMLRGNPPINPIPGSNRLFLSQPPQGGNIPWNSNKNQGQNQWNGQVLVSNQYSWDPNPLRGNPRSGQVLGSNQSF